MQVVSSYGAEIKNKNIPIRHTLALYREAVRCLTEIYETVWTELSMIDQIKRRPPAAEHLVLAPRLEERRVWKECVSTS